MIDISIQQVRTAFDLYRREIEKAQNRHIECYGVRGMMFPERYAFRLALYAEGLKSGTIKSESEHYEDFANALNKLYSSGMSRKEIAEAIGVSESVLSRHERIAEIESKLNKN